MILPVADIIFPTFILLALTLPAALTLFAVSIFPTVLTVLASIPPVTKLPYVLTVTTSLEIVTSVAAINFPAELS